MPNPRPDESFTDDDRASRDPHPALPQGERDFGAAPELPASVRFAPRTVVGRAGGPGSRDLTADLFAPREPPAQALPPPLGEGRGEGARSAPRPAVLFLHGGAWRAGSAAQFHFQSVALAARRGYLALSLEYRLSGEAPFPAALADVKCALRWLRARAPKLGLDPRRIALAGGSAGAHLAALAAATEGLAQYEGDGGYAGESSRADLLILFNGTFDLAALAREGRLVVALAAFLGATFAEQPERYAEASPLARLHSRMPPTLLLHGTADEVAPHAQSVALAARLKALGVPVELELYPGKGHAWFNEEPDRTATLGRVEAFLAARFGDS